MPSLRRMRTLVLAFVVLGATLAFSGLAAPPASATCTSPTQVGCVCIPTYYGGQGIKGGLVWRCVIQPVLP